MRLIDMIQSKRMNVIDFEKLSTIGIMP